MRRVLMVLLLALPATARARSEGRPLSYARDHVWSTTVRFLVVDEKAKVIEKDADAGYVLFDLAEDGKSYRGSLEIITVHTGGQPNIKFAIHVHDRPLWREAGMVERLEKKLRAELGSQPAPKKESPKEEPKPDGKDARNTDKPRLGDEPRSTTP